MDIYWNELNKEIKADILAILMKKYGFNLETTIEDLSKDTAIGRIVLDEKEVLREFLLGAEFDIHTYYVGIDTGRDVEYCDVCGQIQPYGNLLTFVESRDEFDFSMCDHCAATVL